MTQPVINITMLAFNRHELTQRALLALHKCSRAVPFSVTVVDNGSEAPLVARLREFKDAGIIDKLFLLDKNYGIASAANIGWEMTDAPVYMKLDNDIIIKDRDFFSKVFALWRQGDTFSTLGGTDPATFGQSARLLRGPAGVLGLCGGTLGGGAIFIPKAVSDILGFWSEDYGLYGTEDGDYGLRVHALGLPQYSYCWENLLDHLGDDQEATYLSRNFNKTAQARPAIRTEDGGYGLFLINQSLYNLCIRALRPVRRYLVVDVDADCGTRLRETEEYPAYREQLERCARLINQRVRSLAPANPDHVFTLDLVEELKDMARSGGFDFESFFSRYCS